MPPEEWGATYTRFGILRYSAILAALGMKSPTERMVLVVRFLAKRLASREAPPPHLDDARVEEWMTRALADSIPTLPSPNWAEFSLQNLFDESTSLVCWNPYVEFAELLHVEGGPKAYQNARVRLANHGFDSRELDLMGLPEAFVQVRLPRALRTFKPSLGVGNETAWLTQVFYRFALKAVLADPMDRSILDIAAIAKSGEPTPEQAVEANALSILSNQVDHHLRELPPKEQVALRMYFGLPSVPGEPPEPESSFHEIGTRLGCSEYLARKAVVDGLAEIAVRLSVGGPFSSGERALMRCVFLERMNLHAAAHYLSLSLNDARRLLASIGRKLRRGLREQTGPGPKKLR